MDKYGNLSPTYVNFSLGGIHGAELNLKLLNRDKKVIRQLRDKYKYISKIPKNAVDTKLLNIIKKQSRSKLDKIPHRLIHEIPEFYYKTKEVDEIIHPDDFSPFCIDEKSQTDINIHQ